MPQGMELIASATLGRCFCTVHRLKLGEAPPNLETVAVQPLPFALAGADWILWGTGGEGRTSCVYMPFGQIYIRPGLSCAGCQIFSPCPNRWHLAK